MLIAGPRTRIRVRSPRRGALLAAATFGIVAALAVLAHLRYGSTATALVTALLVNTAATPLAHSVRRTRPPIRPPARSPESRLS